MISHALQSFSQGARVALHVRQLAGANDHHIAEAAFKALGRALDAATRRDPRIDEHQGHADGDGAVSGPPAGLPRRARRDGAIPLRRLVNALIGRRLRRRGISSLADPCAGVWRREPRRGAWNMRVARARDRPSPSCSTSSLRSIACVWVGRDRRYERATRNNAARTRRLIPSGGRRLLPSAPLRNAIDFDWNGDTHPGALARFGDALTILWRWNAETQQYEHYRPGAADSANTLRELHLGDALWVDLSSDARWLQSGTANAEFVFRGYVTPEVQSGIRAMTGRVMTHFAERYGIEPPRFTVITDPEGSTNAAPGLIRLGEVHSRLSPSSEVTIAHEYFHVLQFHLRAAGVASPRWMTEGTAAQNLYAQSQGVNTEQVQGARARPRCRYRLVDQAPRSAHRRRAYIEYRARHLAGRRRSRPRSASASETSTSSSRTTV